MRKASLLLAAGLALHGCAYHRLVVASGEAPDQRYHQIDTNAVGWNFSEQQAIAQQCSTNLLSEVRTRTSFLASLATVLTLGFWQPAHMEYRCAKVPAQAGTIEP
jgi:hypothetical protein